MVSSWDQIVAKIENALCSVLKLSRSGSRNVIWKPCGVTAGYATNSEGGGGGGREDVCMYVQCALTCK